jgi:hypothetical protein
MPTRFVPARPSRSGSIGGPCNFGCAQVTPGLDLNLTPRDPRGQELDACELLDLHALVDAVLGSLDGLPIVRRQTYRATEARIDALACMRLDDDGNPNHALGDSGTPR